MKALHRLIFAASLLATLLGPLAAIAQSPYPSGPPPVVPGLPDSARQTTYTITGTTCACSVGFQLYGDSTDFQNWIEVWVNGVQYQYNDPTYGWSLASATGPFATIPRPITDAVLTFNNVQTGTVVIVGAQRPRRTAEFSESQGVTARALNQWFNTVVAMLREFWDKTNDLAGRGLFTQPGNVMGALPLPTACASAFLGFDATGLNPECLQLITAGSIAAPSTTTPGTPLCWGNTTGNSLTNCLVPTAKTANYSVTAADNGDFFTITNRSTLTFNTTPGTYPAGFRIWLYNGNTTTPEAITVSINGTSYFLWPGQVETVYSTGGLPIYSGPHRYKLTTSPSIFMGPSGSCNDANDGLTATSAGQICTFAVAYALLQGSFDASGHNANFFLACGSYTQAFAVFGQGIYFSDGVGIQGPSATPTCAVIQPPSNAIGVSARDYGIIFLSDVEVACGNSGATGIQSSQFSTIDVSGVTTAACVGTMIQALDGGHVDWDVGNTLGGNAATMFFAKGAGSQINFEGTATACLAALTFTTFAESITLAEIEATGASFTGCGSSTGTRYFAGTNSVINTSGGGASFFPGGTAGSTATGGLYE